MTPRDTLQDTIANLISRRSEGTYWDFKLCHHKNKGDLIHDILCLANAKHRGSRFLIFGVNDEDFSLHSISNDPARRTQADIASLIRANAHRFFQSRFPEFYLSEVIVNGTLLDVLVIEDTPHKPYYFVQRYQRIRAHHIYTRVCDTNTPVNDTAQPHEIERMWRERFGLDMPPLERVKLYLNQVDAWVSSNRAGENLYQHHRIFPEFTLKVSEAEEWVARREEWTRGEIRTDNNCAGYYEIHYHQTCLARVRYVTFDDHKKSMVAPNWEVRGGGRFYYYDSDSIEYAVQKFHSALVQEDHSMTLSIQGSGNIDNLARSRWKQHITIPVLSEQELDDFRGPRKDRDSGDPIRSDAEQYEVFLQNLLEFDDWRKRRSKI